MNVTECVLPFLTLQLLSFFGIGENQRTKQKFYNDDAEKVFQPTPVIYWPKDESSSCSLETDSEINDSKERPPAPSSPKDECECDGGGGGSNPIARKVKCMYNGAKSGSKEGALSGIFIGGFLGIFKYFDGTGAKEDEMESSSEKEFSPNESVIFVTAANSAIVMALFGMVLCSSKAAMYCN